MSDMQGIVQNIVISRDKSIYVPEIIKKSIVQRDHNVDRLTFDCPRYWNGIDISKLNIYVNYIAAGHKKQGKEPESFLCENVVADEDNPDIFHFDWRITSNVSGFPDKLIFLVCAKSVDAEGNEDVHWNSRLCTSLEVQEGLEASDSIVNKYPDVIESILSKLGKQIELRNSGTAIQYRNAGENTWVDLVQLEDIKGDAAVIVESNFKGSDTTENILTKTGETGDKWYSTDEGVYYMLSTSGEWINCGSGENLKKIEDEIDALKGDISQLSEEKVDKDKLSLGVAEDGLIYVFVNGEPVGDGVEFGGAIGTRYTITYDLYDVASSNTVKSILEGKSFETILSVEDGYMLPTGNISVTMGGVDITETSYNTDNQTITIDSVTGNIIIYGMAAAEAVPTDIMSSFNYLGATTYSPGTYTAWCPTGLIYDETRDVYAHFMNVRGSHYSTPDQIQLWFNTIDPYTLKHSEPVYIGDGATSVKSGGGFLGTCIKDGVYYAFSESYGCYTSEDGGATWTHHDYETAPTNVWGCYVLSNGRMIMGSDAGATVNYCSISDDNGANWTKIEANAIDSNYGAFDEPTFVEIGNGVVMAIIRKEISTSDPMARPYMRVSSDYGSTWSDAVEMQTVGFMNANNCNAFVHDNYVELFVGCRIPTANSDYTGSLYTINQYVLDRNKGAVDEFEFVNTVFDYQPDTGLEDFGVSTTSTDDFSTPCIAIKNKSHALMMFFAPTRCGVTHHLVAVGNIPVDAYEIPSIIPESYNASQILSSNDTVTICDNYGMTNNKLNGEKYLRVDDIVDGGFLHIGYISNGYTDAFGTSYTVIPLTNVIDGKIKSSTRFSGFSRSPLPDGVTSILYTYARNMKKTYAIGDILDAYAFIRNGEWWVHDEGTWYRSDTGDCDISNITYSNSNDSFAVLPNYLEGLTTYKAVGGLWAYSAVSVFEYDKSIS